MLIDWLTMRIVWAPDGGGDKGGSGGNAGDGGAGSGGGEGGSGNGDGGEDGSGGLLDLATNKAKTDEGDDKGGGQGDKGGGPFDPGGLPGGVLGENDSETITNLLGRYNDLRREHSRRKAQGAADLPDGPDGYKFEPTGDTDKTGLAIKNMLATGDDGEPTDRTAFEFMGVVTEAAHEAGIGQAQLDKMVRGFIERGADVGFLMSEEDQTRINAQEQMAELAKMTGSRAAAQNMVNALEGYGAQLLERGVFSKAELAEFRIACGTALAATAMHKVLVEIAGFKPMPMAGERGEGQYSPDDAYAKQTEMLRMKPGPERDAARAEVDRIFRQVFGEGPAGSSTEARQQAHR